MLLVEIAVDVLSYATISEHMQAASRSIMCARLIVEIIFANVAQPMMSNVSTVLMKIHVYRKPNSRCLQVDRLTA
jgi:hypothetical protein